MRSMRRISLNSTLPAEDSEKKAHTWSHPGGKLCELGSHALKQDELLAILIGAGVPGRPALAIANAILDQYVGLYGIHQQATVEDLASIPGLGYKKASRIMAAVEMGRRLHRLSTRPRLAPQANASLFSSTETTQNPEPQPQGPSDADLLADIIGSGIRGRPPRIIAQDLLSRFGSLSGLFGQDLGDFLNIKGLNSVKIIRIAASLEIAKRIAQAIS